MSQGSNSVYIGNLPFSIQEHEISEVFRGMTIVNIRMIQDRETGRFKGFGFVEFSDQSEAEKAVQLNGTEVGGRQVRINMAEQRASGGGGGGGGRGGGRGGYGGGRGGYGGGGGGYGGGGYGGGGYGGGQGGYGGGQGGYGGGQGGYGGGYAGGAGGYAGY